MSHKIMGQLCGSALVGWTQLMHTEVSFASVNSCWDGWGLTGLGWPFSYVWRLADSWVLFPGSLSTWSFLFQWGHPGLHIWCINGGRIPEERRVEARKAPLALGWRLAQYHLHPIRLVSGSHKVSLDCKPGKIVYTFWFPFSGFWKGLSMYGSNV